MRRAATVRIRDLDFEERARELTARALRLRRKGELRRAALTLREACGLDETDAVRWMLLGDVLLRTGKKEEAALAMKQSLYLRERQGDRARANTIRHVLLTLGRSTAA